jgi:hypothetical protein
MKKVVLFLVLGLLFGAAAVSADTNTLGYLQELKAGPRFIRDSHGVISDRQTGRQWLEGPKDVSWQESGRWIDAQPGEWRRPNWLELKELHQATPCPVTGNHLDPVFRQSTRTVWATRGKVLASGWYPEFGVFWFDFAEKIHNFSALDKATKDLEPKGIRVFAVRSTR